MKIRKIGWAIAGCVLAVVIAWNIYSMLKDTQPQEEYVGDIRYGEGEQLSTTVLSITSSSTEITESDKLIADSIKTVYHQNGRKLTPKDIRSFNRLIKAENSNIKYAVSTKYYCGVYRKGGTCKIAMTKEKWEPEP